MTTIACDGKSMAGDGQREFRGSISTRRAKKVRRLPDGSLLGTCGDVAIGIALVEWLTNGGDKPAPMEPELGFNALLLKPTGEVMLYDKHFVPAEVELPIAIGSGMDFAVGAMLAGKSAAEAVEIAAIRDTGTGGEITVLAIEKPVRAVA